MEEGGILERMKKKSMKKTIPTILYKLQNATNPILSFSFHFSLYKDSRFLVLPWKLYTLNTVIPAVTVSNPIIFVQNQGWKIRLKLLYNPESTNHIYAIWEAIFLPALCLFFGGNSQIKDRYTREQDGAIIFDQEWSWHTSAKHPQTADSGTWPVCCFTHSTA